MMEKHSGASFSHFVLNILMNIFSKWLELTTDQPQAPELLL